MVAALAEQATYVICVMAMINAQRAHWPLAYLALATALPVATVILLWSDSVSHP